MVCLQVIGHDTTVAMAGAEGNFELNVFRPVVAYDVLSSARMLADACDSLRTHLIEGTELNLPQLARNLDESLMLVTALSPEIGYERAAAIAHHALEHDVSLRDAALAEGVDPGRFDELVQRARRPRGHRAAAPQPSKTGDVTEGSAI